MIEIKDHDYNRQADFEGEDEEISGEGLNIFCGK
jgi:hypothetical protein